MSPETMQPRVRRNDWSALEAPRIGAWEPTLSVSVVIPAYGAQRLLPYVLAGLAAQTYPSHLLEVVVADDDPRAPLELPEVRPERTRLVRVEDGWGRANACHTGVLAAEGDVVHWLDADMLVEPDEVEAQLRWHHLIDHAVVLGHKWFVDPEPLLAREPSGDGRMHETFAAAEKGRHWVEDVWDRTDDLRTSGPRALRVHAGATASLRRALYDEAGGMDTSLRLGEDVELGYRLAQCGAVFVADREARAWHLGSSHQQTRQQEVNDYNRPFLADRVPDLQPQRRQGRSYAVPYLQVVLDTRGVDAGAVIATVDAVLASSTHDLVVTLLGDWSALTEERTSPLDDPQRSGRLVRASYLHEPRVELAESLPDGPGPAMFRLTVPGGSWAPGQHTMATLLLHLERTHLGLEQVMLPDGTSVRVERTAAFARARRVARPGEDLDDVVDELFGSWWVEGVDAGFRATADLPPQALRGIATPALEPATVWRQLSKPDREASEEDAGSRRRAARPAPPAASPAPGGRSVRGRIGSLLRRRRH
ncbi:glycosyltransferase family 2 protein [Nocardioides sp.]|uniref:glycosyltransferase family 2 protein n=1 Tax=Nocardioides sp. TaxID=35761 RepID=UPI0025CBB9C9|nr:glycosyltransferase family 2 protein [Nocardioides sp.]